MNENICETCEQSINDCSCIWCDVCKKDMDINFFDECRHLFWHSKDGLWLGTGSHESEWYYDKFQEGFNEFIRDHPQIAEDLIWTIKNGKMGFDAIHFQGSIFGYDSVHCYLNGNWYGDLFTKDLETMSDEKEELYSFFVQWLMGLDKTTEKQNDLAIIWIKNALRCKLVVEFTEGDPYTFTCSSKEECISRTDEIIKNIEKIDLVVSSYHYEY